MPKEIKNFQRSWLTKVDSHGHKLLSWCKEHTSSPNHGFCSVCSKSLSCGNSGLFQILNHAKSKERTETAKAKYGKSQQHFSKPVSTCVNRTSHTDRSTEEKLQINATYKVDKSYNEQVTAAEVQWAMKVAHNNYSDRSI